MALPRPTFSAPAEALATPWGERECDPHDKAGVQMFRDFVIEHQGGVAGGISRACGGPHQSGHYSGRAWDWMISALDAEPKARAEELLDWLLANDAEMFRRAGLVYMIWDKKRWSGFSGRKWVPYDGFDERGQCAEPPCRNPHVDHVHFSFSKPGAAGATSFYDWLRGGKPGDPPKPPKIPLAARSSWPAVVGFAVGFSATMLVAPKVLRARR